MSAALSKTMRRFDAQAAACGDPASYWQSASLFLMVWSCGGVPAAGYGPQVAPDLFNAFTRLGGDFRAAVDARAFPV